MRSRLSFVLMALFAFVPAFSALGCGGGGEEAQPAGEAEPDQPAGEPAPTGTAKVTGTIVFEGEPPPPRPLNMEAEPKCAEMHEEQPVSEALVLGDGQTVANVMLRVVSGLPEGTHPVPSQPAVIDQKGCKYTPRVTGMLAGQTLRFLNSDGILHNVHALPKVNREFNMPMPATVTETDKVFDKPEDIFEIKCDVHPWMKAYVQVFSHPYFAVTAEDGKYEISGLPAGTYTVEAWHELDAFPNQTAEVTVADGETATADFTFKRPE